MLTTKKTIKKSTGLYLEVDLIDKITALAIENDMSINETMVQLLVIALKKVNGEVND